MPDSGASGNESGKTFERAIKAIKNADSEASNEPVNFDRYNNAHIISPCNLLRREWPQKGISINRKLGYLPPSLL